MSAAYNKVAQPPQTAAGLEPLGVGDRLYSVVQKAGMHLNGMTLSPSFKIYNRDGLHIFSAGELPRPFILRRPTWNVQIFVCTPHGDPIFTIRQRNESPCAGLPTSDFHLTAAYRADRSIRPTLFYTDRTFHERIMDGLEEEPEEPEAHVHLRLINGTFLGHFSQDASTVVILDSNFFPILHVSENPDLFPSKVGTSFSSVDVSSKVRAGESNGGKGTTKPGEEARAGRRGWRRRSLDREPKNYDLFEGPMVVGHISCFASLHKFNIEAKPIHCYRSRFPSDFTQVDKALILSFLIYKQRKEYWDERICIGIFGFFLIFVIAFSITSISIALYYQTNHEYTSGNRNGSGHDLR